MLKQLNSRTILVGDHRSRFICLLGSNSKVTKTYCKPLLYSFVQRIIKSCRYCVTCRSRVPQKTNGDEKRQSRRIATVLEWAYKNAGTQSRTDRSGGNAFVRRVKPEARRLNPITLVLFYCLLSTRILTVNSKKTVPKAPFTHGCKWSWSSICLHNKAVNTEVELVFA